MKIAAVVIVAAACASTPAAPETKAAAEKGPATAAEAKAFIDKVNPELRALGIKSSTAQWIQNTYITDDTDRAAAQASEASLAYQTTAVREAARFKDVKGLEPEYARMLENLRVRGAGPSDPAHRLELTTLGTKLSGIYGKGKHCKTANDCKDLEELTQLMAKSRSYDELLDAWVGWRNVSKPMRPL